MLVALIAAIASTTAAIVGLINRVGIDRSVKEANETHKRVNQTHDLVNSRMDAFLAAKDELMRVAKEMEYRLGHDAGMKDQKDAENG